MRAHPDLESDDAPRLDEPIEYRKELDEHPAAALNLLAQLAEDWGGLWQPGEGHTGRLGLPVSAGLRRGWVAGPVEARPPEGAGEGDDEKTLLVFRAEVGEYVVDRASVLVLLIAGAACLAAMVAPFFPRLVGFLPLAVVMGLAAWLMVIARLRNSGPDELLDALLDAHDGAHEEPEPPARD